MPTPAEQFEPSDLSASKPQLWLTELGAEVCSKCHDAAAKRGEGHVNRACKWGSLTQYTQPLHQPP